MRPHLLATLICGALAAGTLVLERAYDQAAGDCRDLNFDPTVLPVGDRAVARSGAGRARGGVFGVVQPPPA